MKTNITTPTKITRQWHLIDLKDQILGRAATDIAQKLMGKNKPYYTAHLDCGDYVVVINAALVNVTGRKRTQKIYRHHTGHPGGFREATFNEVAAKNPNVIIQKAVSGMLPKNKLRSLRMERLKIFANDDHSYQQQFAANKEGKHVNENIKTEN